MNPKQIYTARLQTDAIIEQKIRDGLDRLFDLGFTNYDVNLAIMKKYNNDVASAAEHLCVYGEKGV